MEEFTQELAGYCDRTGPGFRAEPVNAARNTAFLLATATLARHGARALQQHARAGRASRLRPQGPER